MPGEPDIVVPQDLHQSQPVPYNPDSVAGPGQDAHQQHFVVPYMLHSDHSGGSSSAPPSTARPPGTGTRQRESGRGKVRGRSGQKGRTSSTESNDQSSASAPASTSAQSVAASIDAQRTSSASSTITHGSSTQHYEMNAASDHLLDQMRLEVEAAEQQEASSSIINNNTKRKRRAIEASEGVAVFAVGREDAENVEDDDETESDEEEAEAAEDTIHHAVTSKAKNGKGAASVIKTNPVQATILADHDHMDIENDQQNGHISEAESDEDSDLPNEKQALQRMTSKPASPAVKKKGNKQSRAEPEMIVDVEDDGQSTPVVARARRERSEQEEEVEEAAEASRTRSKKSTSKPAAKKEVKPAASARPARSNRATAASASDTGTRGSRASSRLAGGQSISIGTRFPTLEAFINVAGEAILQGGGYGAAVAMVDDEDKTAEDGDDEFCIVTCLDSAERESGGTTIYLGCSVAVEAVFRPGKTKKTTYWEVMDCNLGHCGECMAHKANPKNAPAPYNQTWTKAMKTFMKGAGKPYANGNKPNARDSGVGLQKIEEASDEGAALDGDQLEEDEEEEEEKKPIKTGATTRRAAKRASSEIADVKPATTAATRKSGRASAKSSSKATPAARPAKKAKSCKPAMVKAEKAFSNATPLSEIPELDESILEMLQESRINTLGDLPDRAEMRRFLYDLAVSSNYTRVNHAENFREKWTAEESYLFVQMCQAAPILEWALANRG